MGDRRIFLKNHGTSLFNEDLLKSLISVGSISLVSTFKELVLVLDTDRRKADQQWTTNGHIRLRIDDVQLQSEEIQFDGEILLNHRRFL